LAHDGSGDRVVLKMQDARLEQINEVHAAPSGLVRKIDDDVVGLEHFAVQSTAGQLQGPSILTGERQGFLAAKLTIAPSKFDPNWLVGRQIERNLGGAVGEETAAETKLDRQ